MPRDGLLRLVVAALVTIIGEDRRQVQCVMQVPDSPLLIFPRYLDEVYRTRHEDASEDTIDRYVFFVRKITRGGAASRSIVCLEDQILKLAFAGTCYQRSFSKFWTNRSYAEVTRTSNGRAF
jgi:hypothetical protein